MTPSRLTTGVADRLRPGLAIAVAVLGAALLAGCGSGGTPVYQVLQNSIKQTITNDDRRPVSSVSCSPPLQDVSYQQGIVNVTCLVRFKDGTFYSTQASIEARSYQVSGWHFEFDEPGPLDITTAPLPRPGVSIPATSADSLFYTRNLRPAVNALAARFKHQLILSLALYPGALEAVVGANGQAQLATAHATGRLTVGPPTTFDGERNGITVSQLKPAVPQHLARLISTRGGVPTSMLDHFLLSFHGGYAFWDIYTKNGVAEYTSHLLGDSLKQITGRRRSLN